MFYKLQLQYTIVTINNAVIRVKTYEACTEKHTIVYTHDIFSFILLI